MAGPVRPRRALLPSRSRGPAQGTGRSVPVPDDGPPTDPARALRGRPDRRRAGRTAAPVRLPGRRGRVRGVPAHPAERAAARPAHRHAADGRATRRGRRPGRLLGPHAGPGTATGLLQVALDLARRALGRGVGVGAELACGAPAAQEIPVLVEGDLQFTQPGSLLLGVDLALLGPHAKTALLVHELGDPAQDLLVVHRHSLSQPALICRGHPWRMPDENTEPTRPVPPATEPAPEPAAAPAPPPPPPAFAPSPWGPRRGPRWLPLLLIGLVGLLIGCVIGGGIGFVAGHVTRPGPGPGRGPGSPRSAPPASPGTSDRRPTARPGPAAATGAASCPPPPPGATPRPWA